MAEFFDLGINMLTMIEALVESRVKVKSTKTALYRDQAEDHGNNLRGESSKFRCRSLWTDPSMFEVRNSVCVTGCNRDAVLTAKAWIAELVPDSLAIESFHVKLADDVKDGALFVPKVILAATHRPGQKLLDNTSNNSGQLDLLYDEVCRTGADVLVIYMDLPRCLYPPNKRSIYHEKVAELLFPDQPLLKELALDNQLITVTEQDPSSKSRGLNQIQCNVIREWLELPVMSDHDVYRAAADFLSHSLQWQSSIEDRYYSESEVVYRQRPGVRRGQPVGWVNVSGFASAVETRYRTDDENTAQRGAKRAVNRKRKSYGSVPSSSTSNRGGNINRRRRRNDSDEVLRPLMEDVNQDEFHELVSVHRVSDNLGFVRDCLQSEMYSATTMTYQL